MSTKKIAPMEINGKTVMVEIDDIAIIESESPQCTTQPADLRGSVSA